MIIVGTTKKQALAAATVNTVDQNGNAVLMNRCRLGPGEDFLKLQVVSKDRRASAMLTTDQSIGMDQRTLW